LPGAGAALAPRLSVLFGTDRSRWLDPAELQTYYGIAPVIKKSGRQKTVHWRWNAPWFARQTLMEWAGLTVQYSAWAKAYYQQQKEKQKGHPPSCAASPSSGCASSGAAGRTASPTTKPAIWPACSSAIRSSAHASPRPEKSSKNEK
jgi:hypothetical protein